MIYSITVQPFDFNNYLLKSGHPIKQDTFLSQGNNVYDDKRSIFDSIFVSGLDWITWNVQAGLEESVIVGSVTASYKRNYLKLYVYNPVQ